MQIVPVRIFNMEALPISDTTHKAEVKNYGGETNYYHVLCGCVSGDYDVDLTNLGSKECRNCARILKAKEKDKCKLS